MKTELKYQFIILLFFLALFLLILFVVVDSVNAKYIPPCHPRSPDFWSCYRTQMAVQKPMTPTPPPAPVTKVPYPPPQPYP